MNAARFFAAAFLAAGAACAWGADTYWQHDPATPGEWMTEGNWTGGVPGLADRAYIDNGGTALIRVPGPTCEYLYLGSGPADSGTVEMTGGTLSPVYSAFVGQRGRGTFLQSAGRVSIPYFLVVGRRSTSSGRYELRGAAVLETQGTYVGSNLSGDGGRGSFIQIGGQHLAQDLVVGGSSSGYAVGDYRLDDGGSLSTGLAVIGSLHGTGSFMHRSGNHTCREHVYLGIDQGVGTYELSGTGVLQTKDVTMGRRGDSTFIQTGGTHTVSGGLWIGRSEWADAEYRLSGSGVLDVAAEYIGCDLIAPVPTVSDCRFVQTGGTHRVDNLSLGYAGRPGAYTISGGRLEAGLVSLGIGTFAITALEAEIFVSTSLTLAAGQVFSAAPGAVIHMAGASFRNHSTDPAGLAGLDNLKLIYEGGAGEWGAFEVAGADLGFVPEGFVHNFVLGELTVGGAQPAELRLEDLFDNGNRSSPEALYVHNLTIEAGSTLDLNGLHLYYDGTFVNRGQVVGGTPIPEPATLALLALGGVGLVRRRRRRTFP